MPDSAKPTAGVSQTAGLRWPAFLVISLVTIWVTHAIAFFAHEYAHAITAWLLGWKSNPLALHYGRLTPSNLLSMLDIDENVNYTPIFASGHDGQAGFIAVAGMLIGNVFITYPLSRWGFAAARRRGARAAAFFFYWLCVMSIGNFLDYVPVRTFSASGDMHTLATGFHASPWWIIFLLGVPFLGVEIDFFARFAPDALRWLSPSSATRGVLLIAFTNFLLFCFYGVAGWSSGPISHWISVTCVCVLFPIMMVVGWTLVRRPAMSGTPDSSKLR